MPNSKLPTGLPESMLGLFQKIDSIVQQQTSATKIFNSITKESNSVQKALAFSGIGESPFWMKSLGAVDLLSGYQISNDLNEAKNSAVAYQSALKSVMHVNQLNSMQLHLNINHMIRDFTMWQSNMLPLYSRAFESIGNYSSSIKILSESFKNATKINVPDFIGSTRVSNTEISLPETNSVSRLKANIIKVTEEEDSNSEKEEIRKMLFNALSVSLINENSTNIAVLEFFLDKFNAAFDAIGNNQSFAVINEKISNVKDLLSTKEGKFSVLFSICWFFLAPKIQELPDKFFGDDDNNVTNNIDEVNNQMNINTNVTVNYSTPLSINLGLEYETTRLKLLKNKNSDRSLTIAKIPKGTHLEVSNKVGEWLFVHLLFEGKILEGWTKNSNLKEF